MFIITYALREGWRTYVDLNHAFLAFPGKSGSQERSAIVVLYIL